MLNIASININNMKPNKDSKVLGELYEGIMKSEYVKPKPVALKNPNIQYEMADEKLKRIPSSKPTR